MPATHINHLDPQRLRETMGTNLATSESVEEPTNRWALGKYYYPIRGEKLKTQQELAWIASQDINQFNDPWPWRVHFIDNAQQLLQ